jgi:hypothetical protein
MLTINPSPSSSTNNKYTISYSNKIIDATPGGRWLGSLANMRVGDFHFITTAANFGTTTNGSSYNLAGGDPRGGLFIQKPMMDMPYNQTTPGGRNSHMSSSGGARIVDPKVNWVDGGHSSTVDITTSPSDPNVNNSIPQGLQKQGDPNHWVQKINDSGTLTNVVEPEFALSCSRSGCRFSYSLNGGPETPLGNGTASAAGSGSIGHSMESVGVLMGLGVDTSLRLGVPKVSNVTRPVLLLGVYVNGTAVGLFGVAGAGTQPSAVYLQVRVDGAVAWTNASGLSASSAVSSTERQLPACSDMPVKAMRRLTNTWGIEP